MDMNITPATKEKLKETGKTAGIGAVALAVTLGILRIFGFKVGVSHVSQKRKR
jgi:hypothetical protein